MEREREAGDGGWGGGGEERASLNFVRALSILII